VAYDSTKFIQSSIDEVEEDAGPEAVLIVVVRDLPCSWRRFPVGRYFPVVTIPLSLDRCLQA